VGSGAISGGSISGSSLDVGGGAISGGSISGSGLDVGSGAISGGAISGSDISGDSLNVGSGDISGGDISGDSIDLGSGYMYIDSNDINSDSTLYLNYTSDADVRVGGDFDWAGDLEGFDVFEYEAEQVESVSMTSVSNSVCFLTRHRTQASGNYGALTDCEISNNSGTWRLSAFVNGALLVHCEAMCLRW
jgi:hypothetical protein